MKRADELCFDSEDHLIMIASPNESTPFVTFISTDTHQVVTKLLFDGNNGTKKATDGLEQCGWSPKTGNFYINEPGQQVIAVIDPETVLAGNPKVMTNLPVDANDCAGPAGMAIGPGDHIMLGCGVPNTAMVNINTGATLPGGRFEGLGGDDEVWFNKGDGHYFFPSCNADCRATTGGIGPEVLGVVDTRGPRLDQSVQLAS